MQVEGNCFINASSVAAGDAEGEPGTITFAPVKIGRDCTLGSQTSVGPGTDLPDGGVVKVRPGWLDARVALGEKVCLQGAACSRCRQGGLQPPRPRHSWHKRTLPRHTVPLTSPLTSHPSKFSSCSPPPPPPTPSRCWT